MSTGGKPQIPVQTYQPPFCFQKGYYGNKISNRLQAMVFDKMRVSMGSFGCQDLAVINTSEMEEK